MATEGGRSNEAGPGNGTGNDAGNDAGDGAPGTVLDTTRPTVLSSVPADAATGVSPNVGISATFDEAMAGASLAGATFTVTQGAAVVAGEVSYADGIVTFVPAAALELDKLYSATISVAATDVAGNALAAPYTWSFRTDTVAPIGPKPVALGTAGKYVVLAKSAITNVPTSVITGNLAVSPAAASYITGFALTRAGTRWTSPQVTGSVFAADNDAPTPSNLTTAIGNMQTAYTDAAGRPTPTELNLNAGALGGLVIPPGLYKFTSAVTVASDFTIAGAPNDVWIFQISGNMTMAAAKKMTLSGGARAKNIVWQVAGAVELGTTAHAEGIVLSQTAITLHTGASTNGRLLAQTAVNLEASTVTAPAP